MKKTGYILLFTGLFIMSSCSKSDLAGAIKNDDQESINSVLLSESFDPNIKLEDDSMPLLEYLIRKYDRKDWAEKVANHPDLTVDSKSAVLKNLMADLKGGVSEDWYLSNGSQKIHFRPYANVIFTLAKDIPDDEGNGNKYELDEQSLAIYSGTTLQLFQDEKWMSLGGDNILEVPKKPEYKDVVPSSPGKELIVYAIHPAGMNPQSYIEVYADPFVSYGNEFRWDDKRLFAAIYSGDYQFDGSMEFPDNLEIVLNKLSGNSDYNDYILWVENNLHTFSNYGSEDRPKSVPKRFNAFTDFDDMAPTAINRNVTDFSYDLIMLGSVFSYGEPTIFLKLAVYKDEKLLKTSDVINQDYYDTPEPQVTLERGIIQIFEKGYVLETDVNPDGSINTVERSDTTYYYTVSDQGELIEAKQSLPAIAGSYDYGSTYLAVSGDYLSGFYNNGRYEGNPNFGCSFLFFGSLSELTDKRKIKVTAINPFQLSEKPRSGNLKLHSEEDEIFTVELEGTWEDCWDKNLGLSEMKGSFELYEEKSYLEVRLTTEQTAVYDGKEEQTQVSLAQYEVIIITEESEERYKVMFFTEEGPKEGYIKKAATRELRG